MQEQHRPQNDQAVAWFSGVWEPGGLDFQTGSNAALPPITMWMYTSDEDIMFMKNNGESIEGVTTGWVEQVEQNDEGKWISKVTISGEDSYIIPAAPPGGDETNGYTFKMTQLHFGVVDNLISLKDDNIIYIRLTVDAAKTGGDSMTFKFDYVTATEGVLTTTDLYNSISLYDGSGKLADDTTLQDKIRFADCNPATDGTITLTTDENGKLTLPHSARFLQIAAAVSSDARVPGTPEFKNLAFTEFCLIGDTGTLDFATALGSQPTGTYYVYLKLAPNLDFFVYQDALLDQFIPAHIFFDAKIELEMH